MGVGSPLHSRKEDARGYKGWKWVALIGIECIETELQMTPTGCTRYLVCNRFFEIGIAIALENFNKKTGTCRTRHVPVEG